MTSLFNLFILISRKLRGERGWKFDWKFVEKGLYSWDFFPDELRLLDKITLCRSLIFDFTLEDTFLSRFFG